MQTRTVAIVAAFDTKGIEARYLASIISQRGHRSLTIDVGVIADPPIPTDISALDVADAGGPLPKTETAKVTSTCTVVLKAELERHASNALSGIRRDGGCGDIDSVHAGGVDGAGSRI